MDDLEGDGDLEDELDVDEGDDGLDEDNKSDCLSIDDVTNCSDSAGVQKPKLADEEEMNIQTFDNRRSNIDAIEVDIRGGYQAKDGI